MSEFFPQKKPILYCKNQKNALVKFDCNPFDMGTFSEILKPQVANSDQDASFWVDIICAILSPNSPNPYIHFEAN